MLTLHNRKNVLALQVILELIFTLWDNLLKTTKLPLAGFDILLIFKRFNLFLQLKKL